jgi:nitrogen regulatory protein P-II 1
MKMIKAVIRPERFEFVKKALEDHNIYGMTVYEVMGRGDQRGINLQYRGKAMRVDLLPKIAIEIIIPEKDSEMVIGLVKETAMTGRIGDGKIFVIPVERSIRIRTGEEDQ